MGGFWKITMLEFKAYLDPKDLNRWVSALLKVENQVKFYHGYLPKIHAITFSQLIKKNILTQKYMVRYSKLEPAYSKWKDKYGSKKTGLWELHGHLRNSVSYFKYPIRGKNTIAWMGGIREGIMDKGGTSILGKGNKGPRKPIAMYGRVLEKGGWKKGIFKGYQEPRPLFRDTTNEYEDKGFKNRNLAALRSLKKRWR